MFNALRLLFVGAAIGFLVGLVVNERKHRRMVDTIINDPEMLEMIEQSKYDSDFRWRKEMREAIDGR